MKYSTYFITDHFAECLLNYRNMLVKVRTLWSPKHLLLGQSARIPPAPEVQHSSTSKKRKKIIIRGRGRKNRGWEQKSVIERKRVRKEKRKRGKSKSLSKLIVRIWLGLSQGVSLPIPALRRLDEDLTKWFAERQTNKTADLKHMVKPLEFSQGNIKRVF